jgi:hypothetical protein
MTTSQRFLVAITAVNVACAAISLTRIPEVNAASGRDASPVVRTRQLEVVDASGRVRASIMVHPANPDVRLPDGTTQEESVVFRLVNPDGRPGVKLAASDTHVGLALIAKQGDYLQVFGDGVKGTKDFKPRAVWP